MSMDGNYWNQRNCLVTGGMGFGGGHLTEQLLERGANVYILDRWQPSNSYVTVTGLIDNVEFINGDIRDLDLLKFVLHRYEIDNVFHLAAQPIVPMSVALPYETLSINVMGTFSVLESVRTSAFEPALVVASSGAYYGTTRQQSLIPETQAPNRAANIYSPSKVAVDYTVRAYADTYGVNAAVCRFMNTYGPGSTNFSTIVPQTIYKLINGEPYDFGDRDDGSSTFEFMHVRDMAGAYLAMAENIEKIRGEAFNFSGGNPTCIRDLVMMMSRIYDGRERQPVFRAEPRPVPIRKCLDCAKAYEVLGWRPSTTLEDGLEETIAWYRAYWPKLFKNAGEGQLVAPAA